MNKREIKSTIQHAMPSKTQVSGHMRRAQQRFGKMMKGEKPEDIFLQAAVGAVATSVFLKLLRNTITGGVIGKLIPMAVFAGLYQRFSAQAE